MMPELPILIYTYTTLAIVRVEIGRCPGGGDHGVPPSRAAYRERRYTFGDRAPNNFSTAAAAQYPATGQDEVKICCTDCLHSGYSYSPLDLDLEGHDIADLRAALNVAVHLHSIRRDSLTTSAHCRRSDLLVYRPMPVIS